MHEGVLMVFHLWLHLITIGSHHLAYFVHKSGHKTLNTHGVWCLLPAKFHEAQNIEDYSDTVFPTFSKHFLFWGFSLAVDNFKIIWIAVKMSISVLSLVLL